ncbi:MAG: response regulator transcription factor [Myxococcota bacterium]|nr:response regulator transcription factor [Myxococcota bacterium]
MHAVSPDASSPVDLIRIGVVTLVTTATTQLVVAELRRGSIHVELETADILLVPPALPLYLFSIDARLVKSCVEPIVTWAAACSPRPGLIAIVEEGAAEDCEALLAAGFDDAVTAPLSARELTGRVRAVHRRVHWKISPNGRIRHGRFTLDLHGRSLWLDGQTIALTAIELAVMRVLVEARGRALSRADLLALAWGAQELDTTERAVDNVILRLRRKLPRPELIETVRGVGFRLPE